MSRVAALPLLLLLAAPAQASLEVGADLGVVTRAGAPSLVPSALVGVAFVWRFDESHALGLGVRTLLPLGGLPAPRLQYAYDFGVAGFNLTLPVSLGVSPDLFCSGGCRPAAEARAGLGIRVFDDFRAPWVTLELATPLGIPLERQTLMVGLHVAMRWEPLEEELE